MVDGHSHVSNISEELINILLLLFEEETEEKKICFSIISGL